MSEERITTVETGNSTGPTSAHTTIIRDDAPRSSGAGWLIGIVLVIALIAGFLLVTQTSTSEAAKDNAIAEAAGSVGDAAESVGNAAQNAGEAVENAAKKAGN